MKRIRRVIGFLLALVMVFGMVPPMAVSAEETEPVAETVLETISEETVETTEETEATEEETVVEEPAEETTSPAEETTAPTEAETEPTEAVTEPAEETTVPTEAVTDPTEETTVPTEESSVPTEETIPEETVPEETAQAPLSGSCGENLLWNLEAGVLTITGEGPMENYAIPEEVPWHPYRNSIVTVIIGEGVTAIADNAFIGCDLLQEVQYEGTRNQWNTVTVGEGNELLYSADFRVTRETALASTASTDGGVCPDFLEPIDQITDPEDIPEGFTAIYDLEGLRAVSNNTSGKYILMADIHIEEGIWIPLWTFLGEFEGNGHTISGLYSNTYSYYDVRWGLFTALNGAKISNLKVSGNFENAELGYVGDGVWLGGLAGNSYGNIQITNCVSEMTFNVASNSSYTEIITGGLVGRYIGNGNTATIEDCVYLGRIDSTQYGGGVLGHCTLKSNSTLTIENCRNEADIASCDKAGGILGYASVTSSKLNITKCSNYGNFSSSIWVSPDDVSGQVGPFGGILGYIFGQLSGTVNISLCRNSGNFELGGNVGGILGYSGGTTTVVASCVNTGNIENWYNAGGIAAGVTGFTTIQDCLNTGTIWTKGRAYTGGIAGYGGEIKRCVNVGSVKTPAFSGGATYNSGIVHRPWGSPTEADADASVADCYWLDDGQTNTLYTYYQGLTGDTGRAIRTRGKLTAEELLKEESFVGFDFTNVWMMNPVLGHPVPVGVRLPIDLEIEEVGDNQAITLNDSGDTYAYFKSKPDLMYIYTLDGFPNSAGTAQAQADGLIRIHLGHYREHGTFKGKITFKAVSTVDSIDVIELDRSKTFDIKVTVTPLEFSQKWAVNLDADAGLSLGGGVKFELDVPTLGTFGVEATLGKLQGGLGTGTALNISRSYSGGKNTLEVTSEEADRKKVGVKSGIDGTILKADVDIVSAGTESEFTNTGIYGFRIEDFSPDNKVQRNAIGVYVLNEAMKSRPNNLAMQDFLDTQAKTAYKDAKLDVISGTGAAVSTSFSGGVGSVEIGNVPVVTVYDKEANASISVGQTHYSDGDKKYTTAFASDETYSTLSNSLADGKIAQDYYGREITMEAQSANGEKALETTSLSVDAKTRSFTVGTEYTTDYNRYRFTEKSLAELTASSAGIRSYFAGNQYAIGGDEFKAVGNLLSYGEHPVEYSNVEKKQKVSSHTLGIDVGAVVGAELGITFSYLQEGEHTNAGGFVVDDRKLETSRSNNLTEKIGEKSFTLSKFLTDAVNSLGQKVADFFTQVTGTIQDGAKTLWNWVTGKADSTVNGMVTLCTPSGADPWTRSHTLEISGTEGEKVATMGRPAVISITNNDTGEAITDLSNDPLTFTIRFAAEELAAAGGQGEMPAMYRCSDDGKHLEYIGGIFDETEMTVTAEITRPGQYVLAVPAKDKAPEENPDANAPVPTANITLETEYLMLKKGETAQLEAVVQPTELATAVQWKSEDESIVSVDKTTGLVTAEGVGTAYVIATVNDGETELSARCRVDVTENLELKGVQLGTTKLTTELFSTNYPTFDILLQLPQNLPVAPASTFSLRERPVSSAVAIEEIYFTGDDAKAAFDLVALDDRTVMVVPTEDYALEYPEEIGKTYKSAVTVKKSIPKLKASGLTFNSFYTGQTQKIAITGGTAYSITENKAKANPIPDWLDFNEEDGTLTVNSNAGKKASGKVYLQVKTEEWNVPAEVALSVKNAYKAPGLKLSSTKITMVENAADSNGVELKLQPKSKKDTLEALNVEDISVAEGYAYTAEDFDPVTGTFTLKAKDNFETGTVTLNVHFTDTDEVVPLTVKVSVKKLTLKLPKSITLNKAAMDFGDAAVTVTPGDYRITEDNHVIVLTDKDGNDRSGELTPNYANGKLRIKANDDTKAGTYKLTFRSGNASATMTVNVIDKEPTVSLKAKGTMDLSFPGSEAVVTPSFKNYTGGSFTLEDGDYTITEMKGKKVLNEDVTNSFDVAQEGNTILVTCTDDSVNTGSTYVLNMNLELPNGTVVPGSISLKVKRTAVKLKLSSSKVSLNKSINDAVEVTVTCTTKGYNFIEPLYTEPEELTLDYENGKLIVAVNEKTQPGASYKIQLRAHEDTPATTLTVSILKANKSAIKSSLKAKGSIDVIRDGTEITITPSYKNCGNTAGRNEILQILKSDGTVIADSSWAENDVLTIQKNKQGQYIISKVSDADLDHSVKYKAKLITTFGNSAPIEAAASIKVTMGKTKVTLKNGSNILFAKDKNSRVTFTLTAKDAALNDIATVVSKDERFQVYDYGNGQYAIGFADGVVDSSLIGKKSSKSVTVTLNIFLDGNETEKVNTTAKIKVNVLK